MSTAQSFLIGYLLNSLWQAPLLFAAAWLLALAARRLGPAVAHRIWATTFLLQAILPAIPFNPRTLLRPFQHASAIPSSSITITIGPGYVHGALRPQPTLLDALTIVYLTVILFFAIRLAWRFRQTLLLSRNAQPITLPTEAAQTWQRYSNLFAVPNARLAEHPSIAGPLTFGILHRTVLLPAGWSTSLPPEDLAAALAHEFAHMQRRDFARNLAYELLALPAAYHPILWLTRSHLAESREILCDDLAAAAVDGKKKYAHSLLRLASLFTLGSRPITHHAIGIFDANNLERRIMNLTHNRLELRGLRRTATIAACVTIGLAVCASALAMRLDVQKPLSPLPALPAVPAQPALPAIRPLPTAPMAIAPPPASPAPIASHAALKPTEPSPEIAALEPMPLPPTPEPQAEAQPAPQPDKPLRIQAGVISGNILNKVAPIYPDEARAGHISGSVVLHAIIGKDGNIKQLAVISGPQELQDSALNAVRQWTYRPYLLNGNPTEVDTTITVNYHLNGY